MKKFQTEFYKMCQIAVVSEATCIEIQQQQPEILGEHSVKFHHLKPNNNNIKLITTQKKTFLPIFELFLEASWLDFQLIS